MITKQVWLVLLINFLLLALQGCGSDLSIVATPENEAFEIDPVFREFYNYLGGEENLGEAISNVYIQDSYKSQYLTNGEMVYNPQASSSQFFRMAPIGRMFGSLESDFTSESNDNALIYENHSVYPEFFSLYEKIGSFFVGRPLTGLKYNPNRKRFEQHYENLGMYRLEGEPPGQVHLLAYGAWACDQECSGIESGDATIDFYHSIDPSFKEFVNELGIDFTGFPLSNAYVSTDGKLEQIFENVVLSTENRDNSEIEIRPISKMMNIIPDPPTIRTDIPSFIFYPVDEDYGYNIPSVFWDFITLHGGTEVIGPPITHYTLAPGQGYRQCFANICLLFNPNTDPENPITLEPLGYPYKEMNKGMPRQ